MPKDKPKRTKEEIKKIQRRGLEFGKTGKVKGVGVQLTEGHGEESKKTPLKSKIKKEEAPSISPEGEKITQKEEIIVQPEQIKEAQQVEAEKGEEVVNFEGSVLGVPFNVPIAKSQFQKEGQGLPPELLTIGGAGATRTSKTLINKIDKNIAVNTQKKIATLTGKSFKEVTNTINKKLGNQKINNIVNEKSALSISKAFKTTLVSVASADAIFNWYALDNIISGHSIFLRDLVEDASFGNIDPQTALETAKESQQAREAAITKVELSTAINPLMWPFRKIILAGIEGDIVINTQRMAQLEELASGGSTE